jgi:hypothetical protein
VFAVFVSFNFLDHAAMTIGTTLLAVEFKALEPCTSSRKAFPLPRLAEQYLAFVWEWGRVKRSTDGWMHVRQGFHMRERKGRGGRHG